MTTSSATSDDKVICNIPKNVLADFLWMSNLSHFKAFRRHCGCSISRAFENQQLVWDISFCLQTTSEHRDSTPWCTNWHWEWGRTTLILLDLSTVFDTINNQNYIEFIKSVFWNNKYCSWLFESYFRDRTQTVQIGSCTSTPVKLKYGVPKGSVFVPILFAMYTTLLGNIIKKIAWTSIFTWTILSCIYLSNRCISI